MTTNNPFAQYMPNAGPRNYNTIGTFREQAEKARRRITLYNDALNSLTGMMNGETAIVEYLNRSFANIRRCFNEAYQGVMRKRLSGQITQDAMIRKHSQYAATMKQLTRHEKAIQDKINSHSVLMEDLSLNVQDAIGSEDTFLQSQTSTVITDFGGFQTYLRSVQTRQKQYNTLSKLIVELNKSSNDIYRFLFHLGQQGILNNPDLGGTQSYIRIRDLYSQFIGSTEAEPLVQAVITQELGNLDDTVPPPTNILTVVNPFQNIQFNA